MGIAEKYIDLIRERTELIEKKIGLLKEFLKAVEDLKTLEMSQEEFERTIDQMFCMAYHIHPILEYDDVYYAPNCFTCPIESCTQKELAEFFMKRFLPRR